eukprot:SAG31_NODE_17560_length_666_cov_1.331570_1_plen_83_part_00
MEKDGITATKGGDIEKPPKMVWPELVGEQESAAVAAIRAAHPELIVVAVDEGAPVTMDHREDRVRVRYNPSSGKVTMVPQRG